MNKQQETYTSPEVRVYVVNPVSMIAASGPVKKDGAGFEGYQDGTFNW